MRGLTRRGAAGKRNERGVIVPLTALLMVPLLGMAALAIDTAMMYSEHAQLQNGADAAALAIAHQCSKPADPCPSDQKAAASSYANGNALDDRSDVIAKANSTDRTVDVTTQSQIPDGTNHFPLQFARVLGITSANIQATATATWKYPSSGRGFPLAFSQSCWNFGPATAATATLQKISWKPGTTCTNASGTTLPGGWGWLTNTSTNPCLAVTRIGGLATSNPGMDHPKTCETVLQGWIGTLTAGRTVRVTFPIFDMASGNGNTGTFRIVGYGTFSISGWNFGNASGPYKFREKTTDQVTAALACPGELERCIIGQFVQFQASGGGGGGLNFGTSSVSLTK